MSIGCFCFVVDGDGEDGGDGDDGRDPGRSTFPKAGWSLSKRTSIAKRQ